MGMSLGEKLFYGIVIHGNGDDKPEWLEKIIEKAEEDDDVIDNIDSRLGDSVELTTEYYYDEGVLVLHSPDLVKNSYDQDPIYVLDHINSFDEKTMHEAEKNIRKACVELGHEVSQPRWFTVANYF